MVRAAQAAGGSAYVRLTRWWDDPGGLPTAELCRKHGLSPATFYKLKAKYGGMDLSDAKRLKQLEDENAKLKRLVADVMLDNVVLKDLLGKP